MHHEHDRLTHRVELRIVARRLLGPLAIALFAGIKLASYGDATAALGAYATLLAAETAIIGWDRFRLRRARKRLARFRASRRH